VGTAQGLVGVRDGPSVAMGTRAVVLPLVVAGAVLMLASPTVNTSVQSADSLPAKEVATLQDPRIDEASGMAVSQVHRGVVWIINDSKGGPYVYGIDATGATVARLTLANLANRDWEALAPGVDDSGDPALWIGEIGDNDARFDSVKLYRIPEPTELGDQQSPWRRYELTYPDGAHNAEALMVDPSDGTIYVVTKEALGAGVYATDGAPVPGTTTTMRRVGSAPMFVTDGAISPNADQVALRTYTSLYLYPAGSFLSGDDAGGGRFGLPSQPQGESLAYLRDGKSVLVGSEGIDTAIYEVQLPEATSNGAANLDPSEADATDSALTSPTGIAIALGLVVLLCLGGAVVVARRPRAGSTNSTH
jgi:hypothetical protein